MTITNTIRKWGISSAKLKQLIDEEAIPLVDGEIPSCIKGIVLVDRRYNMINNLSFDQTTLLFIIFSHCRYFYNAKLLNMEDVDYDNYINHLLDEGLIYQADDFNYELTDNGKSLYDSTKARNPKFIKMLLGSARINRIIISKMEELL